MTGAQEKFRQVGMLEDDRIDERHDEGTESELSGRWRAKRYAECKKFYTRQGVSEGYKCRKRTKSEWLAERLRQEAGESD